MVTPGEIVAGKYRVDRVLGQGGMGVVVGATHLTLNQKVALKFMLPVMAAEAPIVGRFLREAQTAVRLRSEHVVRVLDVGTTISGAPYIVMEYCEGTDLGRLLTQRGALPVETAVHYVLQACIALAEAHAVGIVHRDLKPANLFLTHGPDGEPIVKVMDFGIVKVATPDGHDAGLTQTGAIMGSPAYTSPEQLRSSKGVDARADIWALGIILYQLVSGRVPFAGETFSEICLKVAIDPLPQLDPRNLPSGFAAVVERCLKKNPVHRFSDVAALALALVPFAPPSASPLAARVAQVMRSLAGRQSSAHATVFAEGSGPARAVSPGPATVAGRVRGAAASPGTLTDSACEIKARPRRTRTPLVVALLAAIGAAGIGIFLVLSGSFAAARRPAPPARTVESEPVATHSEPAAPAPKIVPPAPEPLPPAPKEPVAPPDAGPTREQQARSPMAAATAPPPREPEASPAEAVPDKPKREPPRAPRPHRPEVPEKHAAEEPQQQPPAVEPPPAPPAPSEAKPAPPVDADRELYRSR